MFYIHSLTLEYNLPTGEYDKCLIDPFGNRFPVSSLSTTQKVTSQRKNDGHQINYHFFLLTAVTKYTVVTYPALFKCFVAVDIITRVTDGKVNKHLPLVNSLYLINAPTKNKNSVIDF